MPERRFWIAIAGAAAAHLAVVGVVAAKVRGRGVAPARVVESVAEVLEVEVGVQGGRMSAAESGPESAQSRPAATRVIPRRAAPPPGLRMTREEEAPEMPELPDPSPWTFSPFAAPSSPPIPLTTPGPSTWRIARESASPPLPELLPRDRDRALGLTPGSPLLPVARDTVRRSHAPSGHARFEILADAAGHVTSVRLASAGSDRQTWTEVALLLERDARGRTLAVPRGAHGLAVLIEVDSAVKTASGLDPGQTSATLATPFGTSQINAQPGKTPRRFDVVIAPNQVDLTMHWGVADALLDGARPDHQVVTAEIVEERPL